MSTTINVRAEVRVPQVPNFLKLVQKETEMGTIDVADLDDDSLLEVAKAWGAALLVNARQRRRIRANEKADGQSRVLDPPPRRKR